jgi:hypothetical protein
MIRKKSGLRCCPNCGYDEFISTKCEEDRQETDGCTMVCLECDWKGFTLQLVKKTAAQLAVEAEDAAAAAVEE